MKMNSNLNLTESQNMNLSRLSLKRKLVTKVKIPSFIEKQAPELEQTEIKAKGLSEEEFIYFQHILNIKARATEEEEKEEGIE